MLLFACDLRAEKFDSSRCYPDATPTLNVQAIHNWLIRKYAQYGNF